MSETSLVKFTKCCKLLSLSLLTIIFLLLRGAAAKKRPFFQSLGRSWISVKLPVKTYFPFILSIYITSQNNIDSDSANWRILPIIHRVGDVADWVKIVQKSTNPFYMQLNLTRISDECNLLCNFSVLYVVTECSFVTYFPRRRTHREI